MKALVTGSTGFIGSHLARTLAVEGHEVRCLVRKSSPAGFWEGKPVTLVRADYDDPSALDRAVEGVDVVFHLGARILAPDWKTYFEANTLSTKRLCEACIRTNPTLRRFVFVSSISASGPSRRGIPKTESDPCEPVSMYGRSKLLAEEAVLAVQDKIPMVIIRPPNVFGEGEAELTMILKAIRFRFLPMPVTGQEEGSLIFVRDLIRALILAAVHEKAIGKTYFVTDGGVYRWRDILNLAAKEMGVSSFTVPIPYPLLYGMASVSETISRLFNAKPAVNREFLRMLRRYNWAYLGQRIVEDLGFRNETSLEQGIRDIIQKSREAGLI